MTASILSGYEVTETLYESAQCLVYRARSEDDGKPIILKMLKEPYPSTEQIAWFQREFETTRSLADIDGVIDVYGVIEEHNHWFILVEDFGAFPIALQLSAGPLGIELFLHIATCTAEVLAAVHARQVIHKDVNPSNIVLNPTTRELKLIDFGISTVLSRECSVLRDPTQLEGTLAYLSPEQTGRMNRVVDYRADFYSLGVTFYELLTGRLPFESADPLELVHAHMARQPIPPCKIDPQIDPPLSAIVLKLLAKNAEDRYQSASGLIHDLQRYQDWRQGKLDRPFCLAEQDTSENFQIPQKLYGRDREIAVLLAAFDRVAGGTSELMLVSGYSGIGKTALVKEIYKSVTERRGYFISGKFGQLQRDVPYAPLIQAFRALMRQLLSESTERIAQWRSRILEALGPNGQVIIDIIPEVELIVGPQEPAPVFEPHEARNRLNITFQNFIAVFTDRHHPLVLFIDDLQWIDIASLELLQTLMVGADHHHLLVIGAYRNNEVSETHPLALGMKRLREAGVVIEELRIRPLDLGHVHDLVADALESSHRETEDLARTVHTKTAGNPFFINEFLKYLYSDGLIQFDYQSSGWTWDLDGIETCAVTENVVDLMVDKVCRLASKTRRALQLAACTGNVFDLRNLAIISEVSRREAAQHLWGAVQEGLIHPLDERYRLVDVAAEQLFEELNIEFRFAHDRVQQAAYSLIDDTEKRRIHWQVGRLLLEKTTESELDQKIFDIVQQLDQGLEYARDGAERVKMARLNLMAGRKAKASGAYEPALRFLQSGASVLLPRNEQASKTPRPSMVEALRESWARHEDLTRSICEEAAETACLVGDYESMRSFIDVVLHHSSSELEKLRAYNTEIQARNAEQRLPEGLEIGVGLLHSLGVEVWREPEAEQIERAAVEAESLWSEEEIESIYDFPQMTDPGKLAAMEVMEKLYVPAYNGDPGLFKLITYNEVILSIKYGMTASSSRGFVSYGTMLCLAGEIEAGYRFGKLALRLTDRFNGRNKASVCYMFNNFLRHYREHISKSIEEFSIGYQSGLDNGDLEFAGMNLWGIVSQSFWGGQELPKVAEEGAELSIRLRRLKQELPNDAVDLFRQLALNLIGDSANPLVLSGEAFDEVEKLTFFRKIKNVSLVGRFFVCKLVLAYLFNEDDRLMEYLGEAEANAYGMPGQMTQNVIAFYGSLARLRRFEDASEEERSEILRKVDAHHKDLTTWADENFEHKAELVAAERCRVLGQTTGARDGYDRSIALAQKHRFVQDEALAHELASHFFRDLGYRHLARNYLRDARYAYERWGARAKMSDLESRFPQDLSRTRSLKVAETRSSRPVTSTGDKAGDFDLHSVLKASQALSGEIVLERLLEKLLHTVIENAGAESASLILEKDGELVIEAEGAVDSSAAGDGLQGEGMRVLESIPLATSECLLPALVNRVARTGEAEVLNDASNEGTFTTDPYVQRKKPKSILCMPLVNQGKLTAILYLENNLATSAFTHERIEVLNLLSAEMAIAIDNARLYTELEAANEELKAYSHTLEDKVTERTNELAERNQQLQVTLEQLRDTQEQLILREKMASLGSLTAGIAHEIRNPLNFVNSFAQLSIGLSEELAEELVEWSEHPDDEHLQEIRQLLEDLSKNAARIEEHGKRANDITNSMLLHTQASSEERVATDVNDLLNGSIRLAYHGMRSREPSFNIKIEESYDESLAPIEVVPQDISRVFINIIENACYAAGKKQDSSSNDVAATVEVRTEKKGEHVAIVVRDNGVGIAEEDLDKVFNPFFTTKPAGEGTGLGLSVSYDIVVRKHAGEIRIDSQRGELTEVTVLLPAAGGG